MNCPKCGKEIADNQKFCGYCGAKLDDIENIQDNNETIQETNEKPHGLNSLQKKIIIAVSCIILVLLIAFGVFQFAQYKKDIEPYQIDTYFEPSGNVLIKLEYEPKIHNGIISVIYKGLKTEDWQIEYFQDYSGDIIPQLKIYKDNKVLPIDIKYIGMELLKNEMPKIKYSISNLKHKDFAIIKNTVKNSGNGNSAYIAMDVPKALNKNEKERLSTKNEWIKIKKEYEAQKEAERKQKEWQEKILSNCVYKTSSGVCFTTQVFEVEPIKNWDGSYWHLDYHTAAKNVCKEQGYKLPSDDDLRSLIGDILGISIKSGVNIETTKYKSDDIPTNYEIFKKIAPKDKHLWEDMSLWEDEEFDEEQAYERSLRKDWGNDVSTQAFVGKYLVKRSICVYDPNGK